MSAAELKGFLTEMHEAIPSSDPWAKRVQTAMAFGYIDPKFIVHLYQTNGFPLEESAALAGRLNLKLDNEGLRHELLMIGMPERRVATLIQQLQAEWQMEKKVA